MVLNQKYLFRVKVVMLGDGEVGKTTMARTYLGGQGYVDTSYRQTIGADIHVKKSQYDIPPLGPIEIVWSIFDLAGQPQFKWVHPDYYRGARAAIIVFDVTRQKTLDNVKLWIRDFMKYVGEIRPMIIIGNKIDLRGRIPSIPPEIGKAYVEKLKEQLNVPVFYAETSALYGINVEESFYLLARTLVEYVLRKKEEDKGATDKEA